jgi:hypothetical protein
MFPLTDDDTPLQGTMDSFLDAPHDDPAFEPTPDSLKDRLKILGALIYASQAGSAVVSETNPGQLSVTLQNGDVFTVKVDGKHVVFSGMAPSQNVDQSLGEIDPHEELSSLVDIADNANLLIQQAMSSNEMEPMVQFGQPSGGDVAPPSPDTLTLPSGAQDNDLAMMQPPAGQSDFQMPQSFQSNMPPAAPPPPNGPQGFAPQTPSPAPPIPPSPLGPNLPNQVPAFPTSARRRISSAMDLLADELQRAGQTEFARRVDSLTNTIEARLKNRK